MRRKINFTTPLSKSMPRQKRFLPPGNIFHIMCRGNNACQIFQADDDFLKYFELFNKYRKEHLFDLYHYCLMPNHLHLLLKIDKKTEFSLFMKRLNLSYFYYFKEKYGWIGHFWQDRFKSVLVDKDSHLIQCGKYIELNPVKGRLVDKPEKYSWSSYQFYAKGVPDKFTKIKKDIFYHTLGKNDNERQKEYRKMVIEEVFEFDNETVAKGEKGFVYNANRRYKYHLVNKKAPLR